jgi:hypothetical protein
MKIFHFERVKGLAVLAAALLCAGCESSSTSDGDAPADGSFPAEITGTIHWLDRNVSSWPQTATLTASVGGGSISMPYDKAKVWPAVDGVNANPWVIVKIGGQWYAGTFEYFKHGQQGKPMCVLAQCGGYGNHFQQAPLNSWRPRSGERIGLMVSGLARGSSLRNVQERSNVAMVTWP